MSEIDRSRQSPELKADIRYVNALLSAIGRFAVNGEGWAQMAMTKKSQGQMVGQAQLKMAEAAILQPIDFPEPEGIMRDDWPEIK